MRKSQSSMTAIGVAIVRAIESEKTAAERICYDPNARQGVTQYLTPESVGSALAFGIPEGTITALLEQRGFTQVHDANFKYLHDTYFTENNAQRTVADGYAIASAITR